VAVVLVASAIAFFSINSNAFSDPVYTLLVSQSVVEHGTLNLDAYEGIDNSHHSLTTANGHLQ